MNKAPRYTMHYNLYIPGVGTHFFHKREHEN